MSFMDYTKDIIDDFMKSIQYQSNDLSYYINKYLTNCNDDLNFNDSDIFIEFDQYELIVGNKYIFMATIYDSYYDINIQNYYSLWINPGLIPSIGIDIKQSHNSKRKRCNANKNRIEFTAFIYNWNALTYYYQGGHKWE
eukprot:93324_1